MKWFVFPAALAVSAVCATAQADLLDRLGIRQDTSFYGSTATSIGDGGGIVDEGYLGGKTPDTGPAVYGGYPFVSGCGEPHSSCCAGLWKGYRGGRRPHCGRRHRWFRHSRARCRGGRLGKRAHLAVGDCCSDFSHTLQKGAGHVTQKGIGHADCGRKPRRRRGLFHWLHRRRARRCDPCGPHGGLAIPGGYPGLYQGGYPAFQGGYSGYPGNPGGYPMEGSIIEEQPGGMDQQLQMESEPDSAPIPPPTQEPELDNSARFRLLPKKLKLFPVRFEF